MKTSYKYFILFAFVVLLSSVVACSKKPAVCAVVVSEKVASNVSEFDQGSFANANVGTASANKTEASKKDAPRHDVVEERVLFNGNDLTGWTNESGGAPVGWTAESGVLRLADPVDGKDLLTKDSFADYILEFEFRFGLKCNSGVKYKIEQPNDRGWVGLEYQVQDDANVDDGKIADRKIASLFDVLPAKESTQAANFPAPTTNEPSGEFRKGKIVVFGSKVEHWLDDEKVLDFDIGSNEWNEAKTQSKFKNQKNFGLVESSPILLQAHGFPVEFRNIKIKILAR